MPKTIDKGGKSTKWSRRMRRQNIKRSTTRKERRHIRQQFRKKR